MRPLNVFRSIVTDQALAWVVDQLNMPDAGSEGNCLADVHGQDFFAGGTLLDS